jgi:CheY-like chemotaxis protein
MAGYKFEEIEVLVVDDNSHMRTLLRELLRNLGIERIVEANDGDSGIQRLGRSSPDVVITDLMMKPVDGLQFTRMVRDPNTSPDPFVPIIMVTGFSDKPRVEEARDAGVTEFLAKPVTCEALYARLETIIERPRPFVRTSSFFGPDRRRRERPLPPDGGRRAEDQRADAEPAGSSRPNVTA